MTSFQVPWEAWSMSGWNGWVGLYVPPPLTPSSIDGVGRGWPDSGSG